MVGVAYEDGDGARTMTATLFASMLVFWLAHAWSEVVGRHIAAGSSFKRRDRTVGTSEASRRGHSAER